MKKIAILMRLLNLFFFYVKCCIVWIFYIIWSNVYFHDWIEKIIHIQNWTKEISESRELAILYTKWTKHILYYIDDMFIKVDNHIHGISPYGLHQVLLIIIVSLLSDNWSKRGFSIKCHKFLSIELHLVFKELMSHLKIDS